MGGSSNRSGRDLVRWSRGAVAVAVAGTWCGGHGGLAGCARTVTKGGGWNAEDPTKRDFRVLGF